jgi:GNAT superfamily N-acetyltransferase
VANVTYWKALGTSGHAVAVTAHSETNSAARRADLSDSDELARLRWLWRVVERGEKGDPVRFQRDFLAWTAEHHRTHVPFLVEVDSRAVGMAWLAIIERIPGPQKWRRLSGFVQSVFVAPEHRNGGLGSQLMEEVIDGARREGSEYLSVHPSPPSFPFYRRLGFAGEGSLLFLALESGKQVPSEPQRTGGRCTS